MRSKKGFRVGRLPMAGVVATAAMAALALGSWAGTAIKPDRQLAIRTQIPIHPDFAFPVASGDTIADRELGQPDFFRGTANLVTPRSLNTAPFILPNGVAIDQSTIPNRVYVADFNNNRVLGWASVAALVNAKPADIVIGQPDFFSNACNAGGVSASTLCFPIGIAVDTSGNLYVADNNNNRVLEYNTPFIATGTPGAGDVIADEVFGQGDSFTSKECLVGPGNLCAPDGVALDSMGNLYVADSGNNRVLEYSFPSINTTADVVFGQSGSFVTKTCNLPVVAATTLCNPTAVALDSNDNVYIADNSNNRVLEYNTPLTTNTAADKVFGQTDFTGKVCNAGGVIGGSLCGPAGLVLDGANNLYVADQRNNRVLEYNTPLITNTVADDVFGQGGVLTTNNCNAPSNAVSASGLCSPGGVALDAAGDLFVMDDANNRVLKYNAPLITDTVADVVLGQSNFLRNGANEWDASAMAAPGFVAIDSHSNRIYVADSSNNRVLGFNNPAAFANGAPADVVIGQADFFSRACNGGVALSASVLCNPQGVTADKNGNLYVADTHNNRILEFDAPVTTGEAAHRVFGQGNFATGGCNGASAAALCGPQGLAVDAAGNLYAADANYNRVLEYNTPITTDTLADKVIGQPNPGTSNCNNGGRTASSLCFPSAVAVDASANLYVADTGNHRVLEYNTPLTSNLIADKVFGQSDVLTTGGCNQGGLNAKSLCNPGGVAVDSGGNLYVGDFSNNRILAYNTPLTKGTTATVVFGQGGAFTSNDPNFGSTTPNPETVKGPNGLAVDAAGNLYAADTGNNRVLGYNAPLKPSPVPTPKPVLVSPGSINFGNVATGNLSLTIQVTLTNTATTAIVVNAINRIGVNPGDFFQNNNCIGSLAGGAKCTISVMFLPSAAVGTVETASLKIVDNASNGPQLVTLKGTSAPPASATPASVNFGNVTAHNTSTPKVVTLANNQSSSLSIVSITIGGTNPGDFAKGATTCGASLPAFGSCTVSVTFTPAALGARAATLSFKDNGGNSPETAALTGTGAPQATVLPTGLTFAATVVSVPSAAKVVTVTNSQSTALTIGAIAIGGTNAGDFAKTTTCGASVAGFGTCTVSVTFKPTALGARAATLTVPDSPDIASPHVIILTGTGSAQVTVSRTSLTFAAQTVGTQSAAQTVTVTNNQPSALTIGGIAISGTNAADFTQASLCPTSLAAHASCNVFVAFKPTVKGARSAQLTITDTPDIGSPHKVTLSGTGS